MTSCFTSRSISSMRSTSQSASLPFSQMVSAASLGMVPISAMASAAWASISNMILNLACGDQMATASGRE